MSTAPASLASSLQKCLHQDVSSISSLTKDVDCWKWRGSFPQEVHPAVISLANSSIHRAGLKSGTCSSSNSIDIKGRTSIKNLSSTEKVTYWITLTASGKRRCDCQFQFLIVCVHVKMLIPRQNKLASNWRLPRVLPWDAYDDLIMFYRSQPWRLFRICALENKSTGWAMNK